MLFASPYASPFGPLGLLVDDAGRLHRIAFLQTPRDDLRAAFAAMKVPSAHRIEMRPSSCDAVRRQLDDYYAGRRWHFDLQLRPGGTPFQEQVWSTLRTIPAGRTWSYRQMAEHIGRPTAIRAVGRANATNPIPIIIPCHRLIGSNGSLTGFAGGLTMKRALLDHEYGAGDARPPSR